MKKITAVLVALLVLVGTLGGCKPKEKNRQAHLDALAAAGIPQELYMDGGVMDEMELTQGVFTYNVIKKYDKVRPYFDTYLEENKAEESFSFETEDMVNNGMYVEEYRQRGFDAWMYQGTIDGVSIYISLVELPRDLSSYTNVVIAYGDGGATPSEDDIVLGEEFVIDGEMLEEKASTDEESAEVTEEQQELPEETEVSEKEDTEEAEETE